MEVENGFYGDKPFHLPGPHFPIPMTGGRVTSMFTAQLKLESPKAGEEDPGPTENEEMHNEPKSTERSRWWMVEISKGCMNGLNAFVERVLLIS